MNKNYYDNWKIIPDNLITENIIDNLYLLNEKRYLLKNKEKYDIIEKYIYDIVNNILKNKNIYFDQFKFHIDFFTKKQSLFPDMHIDYDIEKYNLEKKYIYPMISCVLYLNNDNNFPTILTDIDIEDYKYKNFDNENNLLLSFPRKMKLLTFNGKYMHGISNINNILNNDNNIIVINIWEDIKPLNIDYYDSIQNNYLNLYNRNDNLIILEKNEKIYNHTTGVKIINNDFFEKLFYMKKDIFYLLKDTFSEEIIKNNETILIESKSVPFKNINFFNDLLIKIGDIAYDIIPFYTNESFKNNNRFNEFYILKDIINTISCKWIFNEMIEKKDSNINNINTPSLFNFMLILFNDLISKIKDFYNIDINNNNIKFNITNIFFNKIKNNEIINIKKNLTINLFIFLKQQNIISINDKKIFLNNGDILILIKDDIINISNKDMYYICYEINIGFL
jgi:hypothetical protein